MASGSAQGGPLVIIPCSMGTVGRIVAGTSETLLLRAADVCLKERRQLIIVPRETPLATHHLENLARLSALGRAGHARGAGFLPPARSAGRPGRLHGAAGVRSSGGGGGSGAAVG